MLNLTKFKESDLLLNLDTADNIVNKKYLANLNRYPITPISEDIKGAELNKISRFYKLEQFVFDKSEDTRDKLVSVFQAVASVGASLVIIMDSKKDKINYYIGVKNFSGNLSQAHDVLYKSLSGNFPGIVFSKYENMQDKAAITLNKNDLMELEQDIFERSKQTSQAKSISVITGVAGLRAEKSSEQKFIQGLERVIDAMQGEKYTLMIIADPISNNDLLNFQRNYENLYSAIKPLGATDLTFGKNESRSITQSYSQSISEAINTSITNTLGTTDTTSTSKSKTTGSSHTVGGGIYGGFMGGGFMGGGFMGGGFMGGGFMGGASLNYSYSKNQSVTTGESQSYSQTQSEAETKAKPKPKAKHIRPRILEVFLWLTQKALRLHFNLNLKTRP